MTTRKTYIARNDQRKIKLDDLKLTEALPRANLARIAGGKSLFHSIGKSISHLSSNQITTAAVLYVCGAY